MKMTLIVFAVLVTVSATPCRAKAEEPVESPAKVSPLQIAIWNPVQLVPDDWDVWGLRLNLPYGRNNDLYGLDIGMANRITDNLVGIQLGALLNGGGNVRGIQVATIGNDASIKLNGIQIGALMNSAVEMNGIQLSGYNIASNGCGIQIAVPGNEAIGKMDGIQIGIVGNSVGPSEDWLAFINSGVLAEVQPEESGKFAWAGVLHRDSGDLNGIQICAFVNMVSRDAVGMQFASVNGVGGDMTGLQFSLVSGQTAGKMTGLQISALNILPPFLNSAGELDGIQLSLFLNRARKVRGVQIGIANYCWEMSGVQIGLVNIIKESPVPFFPVVNAHF